MELQTVNLTAFPEADHAAALRALADALERGEYTAVQGVTALLWTKSAKGGGCLTAR